MESVTKYLLKVNIKADHRAWPSDTQKRHKVFTYLQAFGKPISEPCQPRVIISEQDNCGPQNKLGT